MITLPLATATYLLVEPPALKRRLPAAAPVADRPEVAQAAAVR